MVGLGPLQAAKLAQECQDTVAALEAMQEELFRGGAAAFLPAAGGDVVAAQDLPHFSHYIQVAWIAEFLEDDDGE